MKHTKTCHVCGETKDPSDFYRKHSKCIPCTKDYQNARNAEIRGTSLIVVEVDTLKVINPKDAKEVAMKRMLSGARSRAKEKGLMFNLHYDDIQIPNLCPILKIPLIPALDGQNDTSPSLDRRVPYLGYTKGNVTVVSMKANRIKTDANSNEIRAVLEYVLEIEEENT